MASFTECLIVFVTSALLTLFDLDRTFYVPSNTRRKLSLYTWWWSFVAVNGLLAALLYPILRELQALTGIPPLLRAAVGGITYLPSSG